MKDLKLHHPFTCLIAGPTGSGKSTFLKNLINSSLIYPRPRKIFYFYSEAQPLFRTINGVNFIKGLDEEILEKVKNSLVIIDDLMTEAGNSQTISNFFTKGSHHRNNSIILVLQNLFLKSKELRTISLNAHYIVLFKNPRDKSVAQNLARQMYPDKIKAFTQVYENATRRPYSYLFIDLKPETEDDKRLLTSIFKEEGVVFSYII